MFAVVEISKEQYNVRPAQVLVVARLEGEVGATVEFTNILAGGNENSPSIGAPYIKGTVSATIVGHGKGDKVLVFHKKRRKGYQKMNGHRQKYTQIQINTIQL